MKFIKKLVEIFDRKKVITEESKKEDPTFKDFLDIRGYDMETDILVANPNDYVQKSFLQNNNMDLGPVIRMNVKNPAIIRFGYSNNKGKLW